MYLETHVFGEFKLGHGALGPTETRVLLAGVRDCVGRVAVSARRLSRHEGAGAAENAPGVDQAA